MKKPLKHFWREYRQLTLFIVLMIIFRSAVADWNTVPTGSMQPTIVEGDRILVNKMAYDLKIPLTGISIKRLNEPQRGDIIVFDSEAADIRMVKRVIGLPGDVVAMQSNRLIINGKAASYDSITQSASVIEAREHFDNMTHKVRIDSARATHLASFAPIRVPDDHYLVLGDNRNNSADSRVHGLIPRSEIAGRSKEVVISLDYDNYYLPRRERFWHPL